MRFNHDEQHLRRLRARAVFSQGFSEWSSTRSAPRAAPPPRVRATPPRGGRSPPHAASAKAKFGALARASPVRGQGRTRKQEPEASPRSHGPRAPRGHSREEAPRGNGKRAARGAPGQRAGQPEEVSEIKPAAAGGVSQTFSWAVAGTPSPSAQVVQKKPDFVFGWHVVSFNREDTAQNMVTGNCDGTTPRGGTIPPDLCGLWWQDRDPNSQEQVMSFGEATWTPGVEGCRQTTIPFYTKEERETGIIRGPFNETVPCQGRLTFFVYDHRMWAYSHGLTETLAETAAIGKKMTADFVCGGQSEKYLTICKTSPEIGSEMRYKVINSAINTVTYFPSEFYQVRVNKDMWIRYSGYRGKTGSDYLSNVVYYPKRIIDCHGRPTEHWNEFRQGGQKRDVKGPAKDHFGNPMDYRCNASSKVPPKLLIRAHRKTDKEAAKQQDGGGGGIFGSWR